MMPRQGIRGRFAGFWGNIARELDKTMNPEEKARKEIDRQLAACGWVVQKHRAMNITAGPGVAVREFPLKSGYADYLLYAGGKVIGVIEAKPEGHTLKGVEVQSSKYTLGLPDTVPHYRKPCLLPTSPLAW
jgi:type I restriction enzyme R subunit